MAERTDAQVLLRLVHKAMLDAGLPAEAVLIRAGVDLGRLDDPSARTPSAAHERFWTVAAEVSGDPHIGLHLGEHLPVYRGQVLEYLFTSSPTFGEGLKRALAFHRLLSDVISGDLVVEDDGCHLVGRGVTLGPRHTVECVVAGVLTFFASITEGRFEPRSIAFEHSDGAPAAEYERVYGCPVTLGAEATRIEFDRTLLDYPIWHAEPRLLRMHEQVASAQLDEIRRKDRVAEVRRAIGELLETGGTSLESIAERLDVPARRLRSELAEAGTSFQQTLEEYRSRLARRLLARTDEPIEQVAYLAGFSEPSTFYRAFKRWTNETPAEYRRRKQRA
jgi:AraC-like DNA-binding protein